MKKIRYALVLLLGLLLISLTAGCKSKSTSWQEIKQRKTLVIGVDDSFVPMGFRKNNGQLAGFDVDLAKAACKKMGLKADFQTIDWSMKETELRNGTIDVIWNGYTKTKARAKKVIFTQPYLKNNQVLVTRKNEKIHTYSQMKNKVLGMQTGSSGADVFDHYPHVLKDKVKNLILYDTYNEAFLDLKAGRINGLLIDSVYADYYLGHSQYRTEFIKLNLPYPSEKFAVGINPHNQTLRKKLDQALQELAADGTTAALKKKWFN